MFAGKGRAPARLPACRIAQPFADGIPEAAPEFGMLDIREASARQPMRVECILMRLADRRPQQAGFLGLAPGNAVVDMCAHEALVHVQNMRPALVAAGGA